MIVDTTYPDKQITRQINTTVGPAFSWKTRWKMGGIGSKRLRILDISEEYRKYLNAEHYISNLNIELRPKGILLHFRHKLQTYSWIMPFEALEVRKDTLLELVCGDQFIRLEKPDEKFMEKMRTVQTGQFS